MNKIRNILSSIDINIKKIMNNGIIFSFCLLVLSTIILFTYNFFSTSLSLYYIGFYFFKNSLLFGCTFFSFGLVFDRIKKEIF